MFRQCWYGRFCPAPVPPWDILSEEKSLEPRVEVSFSSHSLRTKRRIFFLDFEKFFEAGLFKQAGPSHTDFTPVWDECGTGGVVGRRLVHLLAARRQRWMFVFTAFLLITQTY